MATYKHDDNSVVVIIGSSAGGGTLANELCQKGVKVVVLEAGKRQSPATFINEEWAAFGQLSWTDKRTTSGSWRVARDFPNLLDWPLTLKELEPYYARAEDKMGVTRTHDIPGLPGNNNFKVFYNGVTKMGRSEEHTSELQSPLNL